MSAGIGPPCDIALPKDDEPDSTAAAVKPTTKPRRGFFTFRQLNALAVAIVLSASGMITLENLAFVVFSAIYMYFLSRVAFPLTSARPDPSVYGETNKLLRLRSLFGSVIGLFLPIAYILEGIYEGDKEGIKAAVPHVFFLASQVFIEGVTSSGGFSLPVRVLVPVFFDSMRVLTIMEWVRNEMLKVEAEYGGSGRRLVVGRALAVANFAFWSLNLFGFVLPFYMPKAFNMYYSHKD